MNNMGKVIYEVCVLLFLSEYVLAEEFTGVITEYNPEKRDSVGSTEWKPCISPFVELMGKGFLSLNVDFRIKETYAISAGFLAEGFAPNVMGYYFLGKRHRFEIGGGLTSGFNNEMKMNTFFIHGVAGYRVQKKHGLFFRAGFTPFYVIFLNDDKRSNKLWPFAGVSLGYSFNSKKNDSKK